jgi:hypothetical protein
MALAISRSCPGDHREAEADDLAERVAACSECLAIAVPIEREPPMTSAVLPPGGRTFEVHSSG